MYATRHELTRLITPAPTGIHTFDDMFSSQQQLMCIELIKLITAYKYIMHT